MKAEELIKVIVVVMLVVVFIVFGPLLSIWSLNTLFGLGIEYNMATWAAALMLTSFLASNRRNKQ